MAWTFDTIAGPLGAKVDQVDSSAVFEFGTRAFARAIDSSSASVGVVEFVYVKGVASAAYGKWAMWHQDNHATGLAADGHVGPFGVFVSSLTASKFGWIAIRGKVEALLAASVADNAALFTTATAGQAGATAGSQSEIIGARAAAASGSSAANTEVEIYYPVGASLTG